MDNLLLGTFRLITVIIVISVLCISTDKNKPCAAIIINCSILLKNITKKYNLVQRSTLQNSI